MLKGVSIVIAALFFYIYQGGFAKVETAAQTSGIQSISTNVWPDDIKPAWSLHRWNMDPVKRVALLKYRLIKCRFAVEDYNKLLKEVKEVSPEILAKYNLETEVSLIVGSQKTNSLAITPTLAGKRD